MRLYCEMKSLFSKQQGKEIEQLENSDPGLAVGKQITNLVLLRHTIIIIHVE